MVAAQRGHQIGLATRRMAPVVPSLSSQYTNPASVRSPSNDPVTVPSARGCPTQFGRLQPFTFLFQSTQNTPVASAVNARIVLMSYT